MRSRRPELSRRTVLGLAAGALVSGCLPGKRRADPPAAAPDPDVGLAASIRADELGLIAAYDAAIRGFPALAPTLAPVREQHRQHLAALAPPAAPDQRSSAPLALPPATTPDPAAALRSLVAAERAAAAARVADCLAASPRLAPLLASIGASEAAHASALAGSAVPR